MTNTNPNSPSDAKTAENVSHPLSAEFSKIKRRQALFLHDLDAAAALVASAWLDPASPLTVHVDSETKPDNS